MDVCTANITRNEETFCTHCVHEMNYIYMTSMNDFLFLAAIDDCSAAETIMMTMIMVHFRFCVLGHENIQGANRKHCTCRERGAYYCTCSYYQVYRWEHQDFTLSNEKYLHVNSADSLLSTRLLLKNRDLPQVSIRIKRKVKLTALPAPCLGSGANNQFRPVGNIALNLS